MEGFIFLSKKENYNFYNTDILKKSIDTLKGVNHSYYVIENDQLILIYYTNQYKAYPYKNMGNFIFCPIGQIPTKKNELEEYLISLNDVDKRKFISNLAGTFLIALGDLKKHTIDIFTHITRIESAYIFDSPKEIIVGSDPLIVSAFSNTKLSPEFDSSNFTSFFEMGYFADNLTPYRNVSVLPANTHIQIYNSEVKYFNIDNSFDELMKHDTDNYFNGNLANVFMSSLDTLPPDPTLNLGLTGGKDSRMIFLALLKKGIEVKTFTSGFNDHPDVIIAEHLAEYYKVPHKIKPPLVQDEKILEVDLEKRIINSMKATSGQIYAYENIKPLGEFSENLSINGVAGEILRGGYLIPDNLTKKADKNKIINKFYRFNDMYHNSENKYFHYLESFIDNDLDYFKNLYLHYLLFKSGRWASDSRKGKGYLSNSYMPFLDNRLVKLIMKIKPEEVFSGKLQYELLKSLDEKSTDFRFANNRFNFDKYKPDSISDYQNWYIRRPMFPTSKIGKYNWRVLSNGQDELVNAFKEILLSDRNNPIYNNIDFHKIENLFEYGIEYKYSRFLWALASMSTYINSVSKDYSSYLHKTLKIDIPKDNISEILPDSELIDLTKHLLPLNDSLSIIQDPDTKYIGIQVRNLNKNLYLKTFEGKFNISPNIDRILSLNHAKSIRVNLTMSFTQEITYLYIIFYSNGERLKNIKITPTNIDNNLVFEEKILLDKNADSLRIALKLPNSNTNGTYTIYYSFLEIYY